MGQLRDSDSVMAPINFGEVADITEGNHTFENGTTRAIKVGVPVVDPDSDSEFTAHRYNLAYINANGVEESEKGLICGVVYSFRVQAILQSGTDVPTDAVIKGYF